MADGGEFVEGWLVAQVLGEGAYGEVRLLVHARSGAAVALKAVRGGADGGEGGAREAALHRALRHPHVLRCLGERQHRGLHYVFLEYASGGELFDRIEPDVGMEGTAARRYWRQLLSGVQYLHSRGVAHRDIKPENLLLDAHDNLKISDFGMATLFRHGSRERLLSRVCGTAPYAAPEVLTAAARPYRAAPADLWAAALVLLAALLGELPWERAAAEDVRYRAWAAWAGSDSTAALPPPPPPFCRLDVGALALLKRALFPDPACRATLPTLLQDRWLCQNGAESSGDGEDQLDSNAQGGWRRTWCSQPAGVGCGTEQDYEQLSASDMDAALWCSQPAQPDELALTAGGGGRTTRFVLACSPADALRALEAAADSLGHRWRRVAGGALVVECDGGSAGGGSTAVRAAAARVAGGGGALLELRRWRGCGLAFKRAFLRLRAALAHLLAADQPLDPRLHAAAATA